jgi:hypothetical protein
MKLLFENWRDYLAEEQQPEKCMTVGDLMKVIDISQSDEKSDETKAKAKEWGGQAVKKILPYIMPVIGNAIVDSMEATEVIRTAYDTFKTDDGIDYDEVHDYPVLGKLKIDPELIKVLDDDILTNIDEMYEKQVLSKISEDTCIDKIPNINDFIRGMIARETEQNVVIRDEAR